MQPNCSNGLAGLWAGEGAGRGAWWATVAVASLQNSRPCRMPMPGWFLLVGYTVRFIGLAVVPP